MSSSTNNTTTFPNRLQRQRHEIAYGCTDDRGIERLRRHLVGSAGPFRAKTTSDTLDRDISGSSEGKYGSLLPDRDLCQDTSLDDEGVGSANRFIAKAGMPLDVLIDRETGMRYGGCRPGGSSIIDCPVFGRMAVKAVSSQAKRKAAANADSRS